MPNLESYYPLIGELVVRFQDLDFMINLILICLPGSEPTTMMVVTSALPFGKKLDVLRSIAPNKFRYVQLLEKLDQVIPVISEAEAARNKIVHTTWHRTSSDDKVLSYKPVASRKAGLKSGGVRTGSLDDVRKAIKKVNDAISAVHGLGLDLEKHKILSGTLFSGSDKPRR